MLALAVLTRSSRLTRPLVIGFALIVVLAAGPRLTLGSDPTPARKRQFLAYARQAGAGAVLVEQSWSAPWMDNFNRMGLHGTRVGGMIVYRTA